MPSTKNIKTTPVGIELYKGKRPTWRVGPELGSGACGSVHSLEEIDGSATEWAIKLTPVPTKVTKKKNSTEEINERLLGFEYVMYNNQFQDIQGEYVPRIPMYSKGPPGRGEAEGYNFLVMEKMDSPLTSIVPILLKQGKTSKTLAFGHIATRLLDCVVAIHDRKHVVVDIKSENFMLAKGTGKGRTTIEKLASRIRLLDLALVSPWASVGGMARTNDKTDGVVGTPLYASINLHNGETPSRRDDMEALGYLISELIMKLASGNASMELPWATAGDEDTIGDMKRQMVVDITSEFYELMGSTSVAETMKEYFDEVREYTFKKKPDYEHLSDLLATLRVAMPDEPTPRKSRPRRGRCPEPERSPLPVTSLPTKSGSKRVTRSQAQDDMESPPKMARGESYMETEVIDIADSSFEEYVDAQRESGAFSAHLVAEGGDDSFATAEMDWEPIVDENKDPSPDSKPAALRGVTIVVESGPHKGNAINLVQGRCESIVVGRSPTIGDGEEGLSLPHDSAVENSHIQMTLSISRKLTGVLVKDLKSGSSAFVGSEKIRSGGDWKLFRGDTVRIGETILRVNGLDANKLSSVAKAESSAANPNIGSSAIKAGSEAARVKRSKKSQPEPANEATIIDGTPKLKRRGIRIMVVEGPHKGEVRDLEKGILESINVGSKPSGGAVATMKLNKDADVKATHVRIDLLNSSKLKAVVVTDKSKGHTKVNRDKVNKGRAFINDRILIGNSVLQIRSL